MPQFDKITFFNQIFWLFVFFSGYYLLLLKVFLPKLGAVLKARSKKLQKGTEGVVGFKQEQEEVSVVFNNSIEKMSSVVKKTISDSTAKTDSWVAASIQEINKENLVEGNSLVENTLYKQFVISHLTKKN
jgi:F0F1-type ATP synthase membrane subunit b/b'|tara:strand:+ start:1517 stop:1906 length:390 start_codon:yes stop_codon:yes gene_type:complete